MWSSERSSQISKNIKCGICKYLQVVSSLHHVGRDARVVEQRLGIRVQGEVRGEKQQDLSFSIAPRSGTLGCPRDSFHFVPHELSLQLSRHWFLQS